MAKPILLYSEIFKQSAIDFTNQLLDIPSTDTSETWVNCPGGSLTHGWSMLAALNMRDGENNAIVTGDASSFAFFYLLFMSNVKAYDTSNFLIHRAASWLEEYMTDDEIKDIENRNKIIRKKLEARIDEDIFIEVTGKSFDDIFDMENRLDVRLDAKQALKIGLIDEIVKLDVKKRKAIEANYFNEISALATINNNNKKPRKMGLFKKDPVYLAEIDGAQCVYSKLEAGEKVKAVGDGEVSVSGTFEAGNKQVTVVDNEITAITEVNADSKRLEALEAKVEKVIKVIESKEATATKTENEEVKALEEEVKALTKVIKDAKLSVSSPNLPEGEFKEGLTEEKVSAKRRLRNKKMEA